MGFLNPLGLLALLLIPVIIFLYMLKPKNTPVTVSSIYLWKKAVTESESSIRINRLRSSILMFIQILVVIIIAFMLSGFYIKTKDVPETAIILIDNSVTMKAEDTKPSRIEMAKKDARNFIQTLEGSTNIYIILVKSAPELLVMGTDNKGYAIDAVDSINAVDTNADFDAAFAIVDSIIQKEQNAKIYYYGDKEFKTDKEIVITNYAKSEENVGITAINYTLYEQDSTVSVLVKLKNYGKNTVNVPLSLYLDENLLDAKSVKLTGEAEQDVFFTDILVNNSDIISAVIDINDILKADNRAYSGINQSEAKKAVLVTQMNIFLEKIMTSNPHIDTYLADISVIDELKGYDLYVFDSVIPDKIPEDGGILLINPTSNDIVKEIGMTENPKVYPLEHDITSHVDSVDFSVGITKVYDLLFWADSFFETEYGSIGLAGEYNGQRICVVGFDIHNTDFPLSYSFPVIMTNVFNYLSPAGSIQKGSIYAGQNIKITTLPDTKEAYITYPDGKITSISNLKGESLLTDTQLTGVYSITQKSNSKQVTEYFAVNTPPLNNKINIENRITKQKSKIGLREFYFNLGLLTLLILLAEWFIFNKRRKIDAVKL